MPLEPGSTFAGYQILRFLGSGAMGEVYLAQHPRLPRLEALKVLPASATDDPDYRQRFNREAEIASTLWHPNIVGFHDRGEFDGQLWIAMDFVDGTDAAHLLNDLPHGLAVGDVLEIVDAIANALDYAHQRNLLHRDVKPSNILLSADAAKRRILLADFGIARLADDISGLTATNMFIGSVAYAAPEQLMGQPIDGRADQYALAVTVYQLLSGQPPFQNTNSAVVIGHHLNSPPPRLAQSRPELAAFDDAFAVAMAKNPNDRYPTCGGLAAALRSAAVGARVVPPSIPAPVTQQAPIQFPQPYADLAMAAPAAGSKQLMKILLPLLLLVLLLGGAFSTTQFLRPPPRPSTAAPDWQPYVDYGKQLAVTLMSLDYTKADEDVQHILDGTTGEFRDNFVKQRADLVKTAVDAKAVTTATVNSAGLQSVGNDTASVLVSVTTHVSNEANAKQDPRAWRLEMTVVKADANYKVSKVEFVS